MPNIFAPNSSSPLTTKGDLYGFSTANTRVAVGANGLFLKADSSAGAGVTWASATGTAAIRSVTTTDGATTADSTLVFSGASFTETLFTAVGNSGIILTLVHNGTSLTQVYTIATTGGQTIGGLSNPIMHTNGQILQVQSDGANWVILNSRTITGWVDGGTNTITGTTTNPTKGTTNSDKIWWRRNGSNMDIRMEYRQTAGSAGAGSGDYLYLIPGSQSIDTSFVGTFSTVAPQNVTSVGLVGSARTVLSTSQTGTGFTYVYDSTHFRIILYNGSNVFATSSTFYALTGIVSHEACFSVPISGWLP